MENEVNKIANEQLANNSSSATGKNYDGEPEYVMLPSQGIYYNDLYKGLDKLKVRKLNWEDEDILTTKSYYDNGTLFDEILKNCIVDDNGFKASQLVPVDRDTILWWLRISAFGPEYEIPWTCPEDDCKKSGKATWHLGKFMAPDLPEQYAEELIATGGIVITLPISGLKCKLGVSSIGREREIDKKLKQKKSTLKVTRDYFSTGKLISVIKEIYDAEGKVLKDSESILNWLKTGFNGQPIPILDSRHIFKEAKKISLKIDTKINVTCEHCGYTQEGVEMPMSIYFFWPEFEELSGISGEKY